MALPASLAGLILAMQGTKLIPELRQKFVAFTKTLPTTPKRSSGVELFKMMQPSAFQEISNNLFAAYLTKHGLPDFEGRDKLWIELPAAMSGKTDKSGYLIHKHSDGQGFSIHSASMRKPDDPYRTLIKGNLLPPSSLYVKKFDLILEHIGVVRHVRFTGEKGNNVTISEEHVGDHLKLMQAYLDESKLPPKENYLEDIVSFIEGQTNDMGRQVLSILTIMRHEERWRQHHGIAPNTKKHPSLAFLPVVGADYARLYEGLDTPHQMYEFLNMFDRKPRATTVAAMIADGIEEEEGTGIDEATLRPLKMILNNLPQARILRYDQSVQNLAKRVMREIPPDDIRDMFHKVGLVVNTVWVEGPYQSSAFHVQNEGNVSFVPHMLGGLFKEFDNGYDLVSAIVWDSVHVDPKQRAIKPIISDYRITTDHWCVDSSFKYPKYNAKPEDSPDDLMAGPRELHTLLQTILLLERAKTEILENAGFLPKPKQETETKNKTKVVDGDPSVRRARIYVGKPAKDKTVRVDVTKPPRRLASERPEYVTTDSKLVAWEAKKKILRQTNEDELEYICKFPEDPASQKALLDIEKQFSAAAKATFGDDVTACLTFVPQSKPFWSNKKGGYQHIGAHVRSFLYREYTDPSERTLFTAARELTATRENVTVSPDPHGAPVLILSVGG